MYVCMYVCVDACMYVCMYACMYVCTYVANEYVANECAMSLCTAKMLSLYALTATSATVLLLCTYHSAPSRLPSSPSADGPYAVQGLLYLVSSQPRDSGMYCCVAKNRLGTAMKCTTVTILEESEW